MTIPAGMILNADGYLRYRSPKHLRDRYAHRVYADQLVWETYGRRLLPTEEVHHLCRNRACWPPTDFHLVIMDAAIHHAIDGGGRHRWKRKKVASGRK